MRKPKPYKRKLRWSAVRNEYGKVIAYLGRDPVKWTRAVLVRDETHQLWEWFRWNDKGGLKRGLTNAIKLAEEGI